VPAATIDDYIAQIPNPDVQAAMSQLRDIIHGVAPAAQGVMSYGVPGFKLKKVTLSFAAYKNHCSLFAGHNVRDFTEELKGYKTLRGTIQFPHGKPLPEDLIRRIAKARFDEA
jgi:uncharacterized protein YdhG (YjbR/CyaY superfamily)